MIAPNDVSFYIIVERSVGLFSLIQQTITNIARAVAEGRIPIAYFGNRTAYWTPNGYRQRDTVWEYYFEPVFREYPAAFISPELRSRIDQTFPTQWSGGHFIDDTTFVTCNYGEHPSFGPEALFIPFMSDDPDDVVRRRASEIIRQFVRPRREIVEIVDAFHAEKMSGRFNIGVHLRGTDARLNEKWIERGQVLNLSRYRECITDLLSRFPDAQIFVASDEDLLVATLREMFGSRVIATAAHRHVEGEWHQSGRTGWRMPAFLMKDCDIAAKCGEEAVIDYLLLSRCDWLLHNGSSLARTAMLKAPSLPVTSLVERPATGAPATMQTRVP